MPVEAGDRHFGHHQRRCACAGQDAHLGLFARETFAAGSRRRSARRGVPHSPGRFRCSDAGDGAVNSAWRAASAAGWCRAGQGQAGRRVPRRHRPESRRYRGVDQGQDRIAGPNHCSRFGMACQRPAHHRARSAVTGQQVFLLLQSAAASMP
jgi:hypothetical protein